MIAPKGTHKITADPIYEMETSTVAYWFPKLLNAKLKELNISQGWLAERMGLSVTALRDRLRGRTKIALEEVFGISTLIRVPLDELIGMVPVAPGSYLDTPAEELKIGP